MLALTVFSKYGQHFIHIFWSIVFLNAINYMLFCDIDHISINYFEVGHTAP